jgi:glycosyltransferase involved in cell wall biosynthesis
VTEPLVSVLIPTYNRPRYLIMGLLSVLRQTYANWELVICDDSTNDETEAAVRPYAAADSRIRYVRNPTRLGWPRNGHRCLELARGEFVNFLMDDDLFLDGKLAVMVKAFQERPDVTLVTSARYTIDAEGRVTGIQERLFDNTTVVGGRELAEHMLVNVTNYIGEPTTAMFRMRDMDEPFGCYRGRQYAFMVDVAMWLVLLAKGSAVYIAEPQSCFRVHAGQGQKDDAQQVTSLSEWRTLIADAHAHVFIRETPRYRLTLMGYLHMATAQMQQIIARGHGDVLHHAELLEALHDSVRDMMSGDDG